MKHSDNLRSTMVGAIVIALLLLCGSTPRLQAGPITMTVYVSIAPNYWAGPASWDLYLQRAMDAIENGTGPVGDPANDPAAYRIISSFWPGEIIVSGFFSWNGIADPLAPFDGEFGSRIHFGLHIVSDGDLANQFRLANLWNDMNSTDPWNSLDNDGWWDAPSGGAYNEYTVGIDWGTDRHKGGGDDVRYFNYELPTNLIDELVYVGVGNAYDANYQPGPTNQDKLDCIVQFIDGVAGFAINNRYCLYADDHVTLITCTDDDVPKVPEPATGLLLAAGLGALALARRRRRTRPGTTHLN